MRKDIQAIFKKDMVTRLLCRIVFLSSLFVAGCLLVSSQVFVSSGTRLFIDSGGTILSAVKDTLPYPADMQARIYITKGTLVKNLTEQTNLKNIAYLDFQNPRNSETRHSELVEESPRAKQLAKIKEQKTKTTKTEKLVLIAIKALPIKDSLTSIQDRTIVANGPQRTLLKAIVVEEQLRKVISYYYRRTQIYIYESYSSNNWDAAFFVRPPPLCV